METPSDADSGPVGSAEEFDPSEQPWAPYFGFDAPYEHQADAIEAAISVGMDRGFLAMEAPCGTGKTMAALTAAAHLVRESERYDTVLVVTPVKQQLDQFVTDLRTLNAGLDEPLSGVALVGKADLCPYGREGLFPDDVGVHDRCEDLRENTAALVAGSEPNDGGDHVAEPSVAIPGRRPEPDRWWDRHRASELARAARWDPIESGDDDRATALSTAGATAPYRNAQPSAPDSMIEGEHRPTYCPFEADWYARDTGSPVGFHEGNRHVVTSDEFLPAAVEYGTCPHRVMGVLLEAADVVIGNYNHLFDPRTRGLTASILDERTFVIVDEAHRLDERVRSLLSDSIGRRTLLQAGRDLDLVRQFAGQAPERKAHIRARLVNYDVTLEDLNRASTFYESVVSWLDDRVDRFVTREIDWIDDDPAADRSTPKADRESDHEIPLREPESDDRDELSEWADQQGYRESLWRSLGRIGGAAEAVMGEIDPDRTCVCTTVGRRLGDWWERDRTDYFREITLEYSPRDRYQQELSHQWKRWFNPALVMFNCIPSTELRRIFGSVGGGVLMSATLEPLHIFREVTGLDELAAGDETEPRPVVDRTYPLSFPEENRASWIVDVPPFTARNRGDPSVENRNAIRERYAYVLRTIAKSPGNVLLCLPSYREARWAAERLRSEIDKPILLDETSSNEATTALRESFFAPGDRVLVTSTRGTLTEGVDYAGDGLHTCAVVGVPIVNIGSPRIRAVKHAYADRFGEENAFEYALTVPAVRRTRQALGRVIRGPKERGIRILVGNRYTPGARHSVHPYLSAEERSEFVRMTPMFLESQFDSFWAVPSDEN